MRTDRYFKKLLTKIVIIDIVGHINDRMLSRFWSKVNKTDGCWDWVAGKDKNGYGRFRIGGRGSSTTESHRVSWVISNGINVPSNIFACHSCDNPKCVRPSHLFLGTQKDNMLDMCSKHRSRKQNGELNSHAKLTSKQVKEIREMYVPGIIKQKDIAKIFGISKEYVSAIIRFKTWKI